MMTGWDKLAVCIACGMWLFLGFIIGKDCD